MDTQAFCLQGRARTQTDHSSSREPCLRKPCLQAQARSHGGFQAGTESVTLPSGVSLQELTGTAMTEYQMGGGGGGVT